MPMRILFPEKIIELRINDQVWQGAKRELEVFRDYDYGRIFSLRAMSMKILCPEKAAELGIDDRVWQGMKQVLEEYRGNNWRNFASQAVCMKILCPEKAAELEIGETDWLGMKQKLGEYRKNHKWWDFADQAMHLTFLAADKVEITDKGFEIIMQRKEFKKKKEKSRPERKKF